MATRVDPGLMYELKEYGAVDIEKCFNCGNCTAICPLSENNYPFPRGTIRNIQLGLRNRMVQNLDPWLCYYCGECSETCPKQAEPGETLMAARRWLTAQYDWTGLAGKFYTSKLWEFGAMILTAIFIIILAVILHGPIVTDSVQLNTFAPIELMHTADWIMAVGLVFFIGTNILRMHHYVIRKGSPVKVPLIVYITEAWHFVLHIMTQMRWSECAKDETTQEEKNYKRLPWINHLLMASGYGLMLVLIMFFLPWFQTDDIYPITNPQRWLGYYATAVLLYGAGSVIIGRIKQQRPIHKFSHPSDWIFPVLLLTVTITGILQHAFRYIGLPLATYYTYVIHLAAAFPMLVLEVPFGKWSHLYYRPLAIYFQQVKIRAIELSKQTKEALSPAS
ncbi:MAG: 4Fe-4S ferredoxin [Chloroflexi bacterium]|nr:MAG: 4Fe-4S ferredoxin [Chloroflexota bacterium]